MHSSGFNIKTYLFCAISIILGCSFLYSCKKDQLQPAVTEQVITPSQADLNKILFINKDLGYIVGGIRYDQSDLLRTEDGGKTWSLFHMGADGKKAVYGLAAAAGRVYAVGYDGKIFLKTSDNTEWRYVQTNWWEWFQDITFTEPNKGFIVAGNAYRHGRIFRTDSLGAILQTDSFDFELSDIEFPDASTGYACGFGAVLKTVNGGTTWELQNARGDYFKSLCALDGQRVWIAGYNGSIIRTQDGGHNWERLRNGDDPLLKRYRLRAILFKDGNTGYAAGDNGLVLKTEDGGAHWMEMASFTSKDLRCLSFHPDGSLWTAGAEGAVFRIRE